MNQGIGKWLIFIGIGLIVIGLFYFFAGDKMKWIGHLPGDIRVEKENFKIYIPITTMILLSIFINVIIRLVQYIK